MYLDPGFGSMIIQFVVAGIAACGAYLVIARKHVAEFIRRKRAAKSAEGEHKTK